MKAILVPVNLRANTGPVMDFAVSVAAEQGASLLLLHVIRKQPYDNGTFEPDTAVHQQLCREARVILEQLSRQTIIRGIRSRIMVASGVPSDVIVRCARDIHAEMIAMECGCGDAACTTEQVMRIAPCPVMTWHVGLTESQPESAAIAA